MPIILIVSWVNGIPMDLNLNLLETGSLVMTVFTTAFTLQVTVTIARIKGIWIGSEAPIFCSAMKVFPVYDDLDFFSG
jgi:hypothetical protein